MKNVSMSEYIALKGFNSGSSSNSSSQSDITLYNREGGYSRIHPGQGADRFRTYQKAPGAVLASGQHLPLLGAQVGRGIAGALEASWNKEIQRQKEWEDIANQSPVRPQYPPLPINVPRTEQHITETDKAGFVLPFSHNIGPQNTVKEAKTDADRIAQGHDLHYKYAKTAQDIADADKEAINQFIHEGINSRNPISSAQAIVGATGLAIKQAAEHLLGRTIYGKICLAYVL